MLTLSYPPGGMLVVGGTGRVGEGVVRALAQAEIPVVMTYSSAQEKAEAMALELSKQGAHVVARRMDMSDAASVKAVVDEAQAMPGGLHGLACAGGPVVSLDRIADLPMDTVIAYLSADAVGVLRLFQAVIPGMRKRGDGSIVTCTTIATQKYVPYDGISPFSKGAVDALVRYVAAEEAGHGIRCNAVGIGWVESRTLEEVRQQTQPAPEVVKDELDRLWVMSRLMLDSIKAPGPVDPLAAGHTYAFLASDQARHLTGQTIYLDAGVLL